LTGAALLVLALCLWLRAPLAHAGFATEGTQIANNMQLVAIQLKEVQQLSRLAEQVRNQLKMLDHMATQARRLSQTDWGRAFANLQRLGRVVQQGQALAYSYRDLDRLMQWTYPGYAEYSRTVLHQQTFGERLQSWNRTSMDTMQGTLQAMRLQANLFQEEESTMQALQVMSQNAVGRMQALQAGNMIAAQQVRQVQMLRQLLMAQMGMQAAFLAGREDKEAAQDAAYRQFMRPTGRPVLDNGKRYYPGR
jgi:P-type conjugative transfer protein TrbJ